MQQLRLVHNQLRSDGRSGGEERFARQKDTAQTAVDAVVVLDAAVVVVRST